MSADLSGSKYGNLTVLSAVSDYIAPNRHKHRRWLCRCDCGNELIVMADNLKRTKSCGCLRSTVASITGKNNTVHGDASGGERTRSYRIWSGMKARCLNPRSPEYMLYNGRCITMCKEREDNYAVFKQWALSAGYSNSLSIDRINVNGNYNPSNCRWSTAKEQQNNLRTNRRVVISGRELTIAQISEQYGIPHYKLLVLYHKGFNGDRIMEYIESNKQR